MKKQLNVTGIPYVSVISIFVVSLLLPCAQANAEGIGGVWSTSEGKMTFPDVSSGSVRAPYTYDQGRIIGSIAGHVLTGYWVEAGSSQKCKYQKDGSYHWGRVEFTFNADFTEFSGTWGYCEEAFRASWGGSKIESADKAGSADTKCDDYARIIHDIQEQVRVAHGEYSQLVDEMEEFDKKTRVNLCTKDVDHFTQIGIIQFDDSWNSWLSGVSSKIVPLSKMPTLGPFVSKIRNGIRFFTGAIETLESEQLPVREAWAKYQEILVMREAVVGNLHRGIQQYYCRQIFDHDAKLYDLYHNGIPRNCNAFEANSLIERITRNRPAGLAPIWVESNYQAAADICR